MAKIDEVPEALRSHIREIAKKSNFENPEEAVEKMAEGWLEKQDAFQDKLAELGMEEVDSFEAEDDRGVIALTRSGSIVNIGPKEYARHVEYSSIGLRSNVPPASEKDGSRLGGDLKTGEPLNFEVGPVKSTSDIYKIAVCPKDMDPEEMKNTLTNATRALEEEFANINETMQL